LFPFSKVNVELLKRKFAKGSEKSLSLVELIRKTTLGVLDAEEDEEDEDEEEEEEEFREDWLKI